MLLRTLISTSLQRRYNKFLSLWILCFYINKQFEFGFVIIFLNNCVLDFVQVYSDSSYRQSCMAMVALNISGCSRTAHYNLNVTVFLFAQKEETFTSRVFESILTAPQSCHQDLDWLMVHSNSKPLLVRRHLQRGLDCWQPGEPQSDSRSSSGPRQNATDSLDTDNPSLRHCCIRTDQNCLLNIRQVF